MAGASVGCRVSSFLFFSFLLLAGGYCPAKGVFFWRWTADAARHPGVVASRRGEGLFPSCFFSRWMTDAARHPGVVASRRGEALFPSCFFSRWMTDAARHLGVVASRRGAGGERGRPLYTPYDPLLPCPRGERRHCRMTCTLSAARRWGQIGAHLPASRVICAPAPALPRCGDRLRAPARWRYKNPPGLRPAPQGAFPFRMQVSPGTKAFPCPAGGLSSARRLSPVCGKLSSRLCFMWLCWSVSTYPTGSFPLSDAGFPRHKGFPLPCGGPFLGTEAFSCLWEAFFPSLLYVALLVGLHLSHRELSPFGCRFPPAQRLSPALRGAFPRHGGFLLSAGGFSTGMGFLMGGHLPPLPSSH